MKITASPLRLPNARSNFPSLPQNMEFSSSGRIVPAGTIKSDMRKADILKFSDMLAIDAVI